MVISLTYIYTNAMTAELPNRPAFTEVSILQQSEPAEKTGGAAVAAIVFDLAREGHLALEPRELQGIAIIRESHPPEGPLTPEKQDVMELLFPDNSQEAVPHWPGDMPIAPEVFERARHRLVQQGLIRSIQPDKLQRTAEKVLWAATFTGSAAIALFWRKQFGGNDPALIVFIRSLVIGASAEIVMRLGFALAHLDGAWPTKAGKQYMAAIRERYIPQPDEPPLYNLPYWIVAGSPAYATKKAITPGMPRPEWWRGPWGTSADPNNLGPAWYHICDAATTMRRAFQPKPKWRLKLPDDLAEVAGSDN